MSDQDTQHSEEEMDQFEEQMERDSDEAGHAYHAAKSGTAKSRPIFLPELVEADEEFIGVCDPSAYVMYNRAHAGLFYTLRRKYGLLIVTSMCDAAYD